MSDPAFELQKAVYTLLTGDSELATIMGGAVAVFDLPPEGTPPPYLQLDVSGSREWDVTPYDDAAIPGASPRNGIGKEHTLTLHSWSAYEGAREISLTMRRIEELLREPQLSLTGHRVVNIRFAFADRLRDPDGQAYHGITQYRVVTEEL